MARRLVIGVGLTLAGALISDLLYVLLVVPRLPGWHAVPLGWRALIYLLVVTAAVSAGFFLRAWREVVPFTLALAGTAQLHDSGAVMLHLPGTAKS